MKQLFCDCKTDEEKANFFLSGRAVETGIIASAISNDVAMAYHRCAEFQKEIDILHAKIEQMDEALESLLIRCDDSDSAMYGTLSTSFVRDTVRIARAALEESK